MYAVLSCFCLWNFDSEKVFPPAKYTVCEKSWMLSVGCCYPTQLQVEGGKGARADLCHKTLCNVTIESVSGAFYLRPVYYHNMLFSFSVIHAQCINWKIFGLKYIWLAVSRVQAKINWSKIHKKLSQPEKAWCNMSVYYVQKFEEHF